MFPLKWGEHRLSLYQGKRILVTGGTGFKGSWLLAWLNMLGAYTLDISRNPPSLPSHYDALKIDEMGRHRTLRVDLRYSRDMAEVQQVIDDFRPDLVFHLAAMAIVSKTFGDPLGTFEGNVLSALNILEVCRRSPSIKGLVMVTTDKVYAENNGAGGYPLTEADALGGLDPYSSSKVCVEHITECYRTQYFPNIAAARAGNVIGGGDWAYKRLFPDIVQATVRGEAVEIHTPNATRPWQHVLEPLYGYLLLGREFLEGKDAGGAWNIGPKDSLSVLDVLNIAKIKWSAIQYYVLEQEHHPSMVAELRLSSLKIQTLGWWQVMGPASAVAHTIDWYREYYEKGRVITCQQIESFMQRTA